VAPFGASVNSRVLGWEEKFMPNTAYRVKRILELLFSDVQQREAARRIGVSHSLLSRTLSGERGPSKTLLEKLASVPNVNPRWLFDEIGQPLLSDGTSLPVITKLPEATRTSWREAAAGNERFRISENHFSDTRYWCRLTKPTVNSWGEWGQNRLRVKDGDFLLLETDPKQIKSLPGRARVVVVAHPDVAKGKPTWGILLSDMRFFAFISGDRRNQTEQKGKTTTRRIRRKITPQKSDAELASAVTSQETKSADIPPELVVKPEDVMAVVIEMTSDSLIQDASD
jgi:transcriptional regulator with XRE-family HTH domain